MEIKIITHKSGNGYITESPDVHEFSGFGKNEEQSIQNFKNLYKKYYPKEK